MTQRDHTCKISTGDDGAFLKAEWKTLPNYGKNLTRLYSRVQDLTSSIRPNFLFLYSFSVKESPRLPKLENVLRP